MEKRFTIWLKLRKKRKNGLKILVLHHSRWKSERNTLISSYCHKIHQVQCDTDPTTRRLCHLTTLFTVLLARIVLVFNLENLFYQINLALMNILRSVLLRKGEKTEWSQASICWKKSNRMTVLRMIKIVMARLVRKEPPVRAWAFRLLQTTLDRMKNHLGNYRQSLIIDMSIQERMCRWRNRYLHSTTRIHLYCITVYLSMHLTNQGLKELMILMIWTKNSIKCRFLVATANGKLFWQQWRQPFIHWEDSLIQTTTRCIPKLII